jgi:hypothetical protein
VRDSRMQNPRRPSPDPSPLSEAGGRALQFCRKLGCHFSKGVAVGKKRLLDPSFRRRAFGSSKSAFFSGSCPFHCLNLEAETAESVCELDFGECDGRNPEDFSLEATTFI